MKWLNIILELSKVRITFAVALTTITGYLLAGGSFDAGLALPTLGIFLLACGSSAINHFQEREYDALMERTRHRPIPSGRISPYGALAVALILVASGTLILHFGSGFIEMQLGLLALIWYNAIYTPMKRRSYFAAVPGAVIGAIPPVVGWVAGGGKLSDPSIGIIALFFFIWQVPHFWLLMLKYGKEYEAAGMKSITKIYSMQQVRNITFVWTVATAISVLMLPAFGIVESLAVIAMMLISSVWLVISFAGMLRSNAGNAFNPIRYFMKINYFVLVIILCLSVDSLLK